MRWGFLLGLLGILAVLLFAAGCDFGLTGGVVVNPNDNCASLDESSKEDCYLNQLKCSKITTTALRDSCVAQLALVKDDVAVCDLVKRDNTKGFCQFQLINLTGSSQDCKSIDNQFWSDNCNLNFALRDNDVKLCGQLSGNQRNSCFEQIAFATNDYVVCHALPDIDEARCIYEIAKIIKDENACDELKGTLHKSACYSRIAQLKEDVSLCEKVQTPLVRDKCFAAFE